MSINNDPSQPLIMTPFNKFKGKVKFSNDISLLEKSDILAAAILEGPIEHRPFEDPKVYVRRGSKGIAVACSAAAKLPYIPIALLSPGGPFAAVANSVSFFVLEYWAIGGTINDLFGPKGNHEIILLNRNGIKKVYQVAAVTASLVLSLFSQLPSSFPALDYDNLPVLGFTVVLVAGAFLPTRSLQLSIEKAIQLRQLSHGEVEQRIQQVRKETLSLIQQHKKLFLEMGYEEKTDLIAALALIRQTTNAETKVVSYVEKILVPSLSIDQAHKTSLSDRIAILTGTWLFASFQTALAIYSFEKAKEYLVDNDYVAGLSASAIIISNSYLMGRSIIDTTRTITQSVLNFLVCKKEKPISEQIHPKLTLSLKLIGLVMNLGALGVTLVIWGDFFKSNLPERIYFESTVAVSLFLLLFTATLDMVDSMIEDIILKKGQPDYQQIVQLSVEFKNLERLIDNSSLLDFTTFLSNFPENLKNTLIERAKLTSSQLEEYVKSLPTVDSRYITV